MYSVLEINLDTDDFQEIITFIMILSYSLSSKLVLEELSNVDNLVIF